MIFYILLGILLGVIATVLFIRRRTDGDLVINIPDYEDEVPILTSEWNIPIQFVMSKKNVRMKVVVRQLNTRK